MNKDDHRTRSRNDQWVYPVTFADGRRTFLFKTLVSNVCVNDCRYCPLRSDSDPERVSLEPEKLAHLFLEYRQKKIVNGIFLSSGVEGTPDSAMDKINTTAKLIRRYGFAGYMHLKILPGASDGAVEEAVSLASAVSVNIETAGEKHFKNLTDSKDYVNDIIRPIKLISSLTARGNRYSNVKQTTQFVVGASNETDGEIIGYSWRLYKKLGLSRVYFSAYQRGLGETDLPGEHSVHDNKDLLTREHRLYQADWLMRKYNFNAGEIPLGPNGNLSLHVDPKEAWARVNPSFFPVNINRAQKFDLLRVPGFGHVTAGRILDLRKKGFIFRKPSDIRSKSRLIEKASAYITF